MDTIIFETKNDNDSIAVCSFDDTIEKEFALLEDQLTSQEKKEIKNLHNENFRRQKMAARLLLNKLLGETGRIEYNEHGKPLLKSHPFDISFSHAKDKVAVMLSKKTAGIDIQDISPRIRRIVHKYMNQPELDSLKEETYETQATIYWCAKETLYKAYGERQLIFTDNLIIQPFTSIKNYGTFQGSISLQNSTKTFAMNYKLLGVFSLVYLWNE